MTTPLSDVFGLMCRSSRRHRFSRQRRGWRRRQTPAGSGTWKSSCCRRNAFARGSRGRRPFQATGGDGRIGSASGRTGRGCHHRPRERGGRCRRSARAGNDADARRIGVNLGTRFLASRATPIPDGSKQAIPVTESSRIGKFAPWNAAIPPVEVDCFTIQNVIRTRITDKMEARSRRTA